MNSPDDSYQASNTGPWWTRIVNNRNAVIAVVALYLVYFLTGLYNTGLSTLAAQVTHLETSLAEHREADRAYNAKLIDLMTRLNDQAVIQNRIARINCWNNAKTSEQRLACYDQSSNNSMTAR
jgi:hypothetical protein